MDTFLLYGGYGEVQYGGDDTTRGYRYMQESGKKRKKEKGKGKNRKKEKIKYEIGINS